jgi:GNAT superfamily N-acetyltransferase
MAAGLPGPLGTWQADIGVVVADAWQGRGVGSALMNALITRARCRGVSCLSMDVLPGNSRVLAMIASRWPTARIHQGTDFITICARLTAATGNSPVPTLGPRGQAA